MEIEDADEYRGRAMERWSVDDDRGHIRPLQGPARWPWLALILVVVAGAVSYYLYAYRAPEPPVAAPAAATAPAAPAAVQPQAAGKLVLPQAEAQKSLPALENSDSMMRQSIAGLVGGGAFNEFIVPDQLVRRIVATVDNLPRPTAPRRMLPLNPVPGAFASVGTGEATVIDRANFARYQPLVRVLQAVNVQALISAYVQIYPLFQRAYEELGYPGRYFNDRLLEALDDLIAAPEVDGPLKVMRPRVLYEFVDPDLESRSAGQKIMLRMGAENAAAVKAKLAEIRRAIVAASRPAR